MKGDRRGTVIVEVNVCGPVGCGKSAICGEIEIALRAIGVKVSWPDGDDEKRLTHADWQSALDLYDPTVVIREIIQKPNQTPTNPIPGTAGK